MQTIGLIGGMSWESSVEYYRIINQGVNARCGGLHSARCLMASVDFAPIEALLRQERWEDIADMLIQVARSLELAGADFLVICTNTMHKLADRVQGAVSIPLLHIADATGARIRSAGLKRVALLGTRATMTGRFYRDRLRDHFGLSVAVPRKEEMAMVDRVIFDELCRGQIRDESRERYLSVMERMTQDGAQGVILGCTEIGLLIRQPDIQAPLFDTTRIHAEAAVDFALQEM